MRRALQCTIRIALAIVSAMRSSGRVRLSLRLDVENVGGARNLIAQESEFTPRQFSIPRLLSATATVRF